MCELSRIKTANGMQMVAAQKKDCVINIIDVAQDQEDISQIVLFGSAATNKCRKDSDIDLVIVGDISKTKMLRSKAYKEFLRKVRHFNKNQSYDIFYFDKKQYDNMSGIIKDEINKGITLFNREAVV